MVPTVGDIQTPLRVKLHRVRRPELSWSETDLAPLLDEVALTVKFQNAAGSPFRRIRALPTVPIRHKDVAVRRGDHITRLVELPRSTARLSGRAKTQEFLALRAELDDLVPLGPGFVPLRVGNPNIASVIDMKPVRQHEQPGAEGSHDLASVLVELEDRVAVRVLLATTGQRHATTAIVGPDVTVWTDVEKTDRPY